MTRTIAFACDHAAYGIRDVVIGYIRETTSKAGEGGDVEVRYLGPDTADAVDYPDYAERVAQCVASGECEAGVLVCGTGIGMSIAANKMIGVRAALCHDHLTAKLSRSHNNANVLCMGERISGAEVMRDMIHVFLSTPFSGAARHQTRLDKVAAIEHKRQEQLQQQDLQQ